MADNIDIDVEEELEENIELGVDEAFVEAVSPRASVVATPSGALITITDIEGTTSVEVSNGAKGDTGVGITSLYVSEEDYHLYVELTTGETVDTGVSIRGAQGETGVGVSDAYIDMNYHLIIELTDGTVIDTGQSIKGDTGETGNGIASVSIDSDGYLHITFTDETEYTSDVTLFGRVHDVIVNGYTKVDNLGNARFAVPDNIVNGLATGSLRGVDTAPESDSYRLGTDAIAIGAQTKASGNFSFAGGGGSTASGVGSFAHGAGVTASDDYSHAEGNGTTASEQYAHSEGSGTTASGIASHAENNNTEASGDYAHSEGTATHATAENAHAEGGGTTASANQAHAEGGGTKASGKSQHVFGEYNIEDASSSPSARATYVEIVGNGTSNSNRSNARALDWYGHETLADTLTVSRNATSAMEVVTKQQLDAITVPVQDVEVDGESVVNASGVAEITLPQVPVKDVLVNGESVVDGQGNANIDIPIITKTVTGNPIVVDDADGAVQALDVELLPKQEGTPTQDSTIYNEPYLSKTSPSFNSEYDELVGGTVAWNQLMSKNSAIATYTKMGLTLTREQDTPTWSVTGTFESGGGDKNFYLYSGTPISFIKNHVYLFNNTSKYFKMYLYGGFTIPRIDYCSIGKLTGDGNGHFCFNTNHLAADTVINETFSLNIFDLTQMFGTTIADRAYTLESGTAGAGISWLRSYGFFTEDYYEYNAGELMSTKPTAHVTSETYPLAGVDLRGIPKLDASNNLYYDGDEYQSDGTVTRKYGEQTVTKDNTFTMATAGSGAGEFRYFTVSGAVDTEAWTSNVISNLFIPNVSGVTTGTRVQYDGSKCLRIVTTMDSSLNSVDALKTYLTNNPLVVIYPLATPTTEEADPYQNPQEVGTTESYTDNRAVPIPVGHETRYADIYPITGRTQTEITDRGVNQWDEQWELGVYDSQTSVVEKYATTTHIRSKNYIPATPNTTYYFNSAGKNVHLIVADASDNVLYRSTTLNNGTFTTPSNGTRIYFNMAMAYGNTYNHDLAINLPSTKTAYEPYKSTTKTVDLPHTVYGADVDVTGGDGKETWQNIASYNGETISEPWLSSMDEYVQGTTPTIGAQVTYELATPTDLQTTPTDVELYKGDNVVSGDGDMNMTYVRNLQKIIDKLGI